MSYVIKSELTGKFRGVVTAWTHVYPEAQKFCLLSHARRCALKSRAVGPLLIIENYGMDSETIVSRVFTTESVAS